MNGKNNPCPKGFRLPTSVELEAEIATWSSKNAKGAFASPLKLPLSGYRTNGNGSLTDAGLSGDYWTSTKDGIYSRGLYFDVSSAGMDAGGVHVGSLFVASKSNSLTGFICYQSNFGIFINSPFLSAEACAIIPGAV